MIVAHLSLKSIITSLLRRCGARPNFFFSRHRTLDESWASVRALSLSIDFLLSTEWLCRHDASGLSFVFFFLSHLHPLGLSQGLCHEETLFPYIKLTADLDIGKRFWVNFYTTRTTSSRVSSDSST